MQSKRWDRALEEEMLRIWKKDHKHSFSINTEKPVFTIDTPPPYPSGRPWHIGAAAHYSQIDMIARTRRMQGFEVYFPVGIDRNGMPVEMYTEKKYKVAFHEVSREKFVEMCRTALDELEEEMLTIMKRMGLSCDFDHYYRTDSPEYRAVTQAAFIRLWKRGLIYSANRPNNYCLDCRTTLADADLGYIENPTKLVYMKFTVQETGEPLVVATTRPELLGACRAVIVHPEDNRFKSVHGKHAIIPIYNTRVPITPHPAAKPEFGSGAVMVCSYGDSADVALFRELGLEEVVSIGVNGRMSRSMGFVSGLTVWEARPRMVEELQTRGALVKMEDIAHRIPICERSKSPIEIIPMSELYLKQLEHIGDMIRVAQELEFHPPRHRQILLDWIGSVTIDWPITRRRYYGTEVPLWYCVTCGATHVPEPGPYYQPWRDAAPWEKCSSCGGKLKGEERTLDTWMDSSGSPLYISKHHSDTDFFNKVYSNILRPQGKDIVRTWLYYSLLRCYLETNRSPFKDAWIMGYGVDEKGQRMSKSKGNVIDPIPILERWGADTFRYWAASEASLGADFRCSEDRIATAQKFLTKLWNVARFISSFEFEEAATLSVSDQWIQAELSNLITECRAGYDQLDFFVPATRIREFVWNLLASHYAEMSKARAYGTGFSESDRRAARFTLHTCLRNCLLLLAPITPLIADYIWRKLYDGSVHSLPFPSPSQDGDLRRLTPLIIAFNSKIWNLKKERGLSLREPIELEIPVELREFSVDLNSMHNIKRPSS